MFKMAKATVPKSPNTRQASLATFMVKKDAAKPKSEPVVIDLSDEGEYVQQPASKRRKLSPVRDMQQSSEDEKKESVAAVVKDGGSSERRNELEDPLATYPPKDHPSYHLPPNPGFNHPIIIDPIPDALTSSLKFNTTPKTTIKPQLGMDLLYLKRFIDPACSSELTKYLLDALPWYRVRYTVRGININTPRYTTVFGKDATPTPWGGYDKARPRAIPPILLRLMQKVEQVTNETYNFVLVNYYSDGNDSISYHSDSESFLGPNPTIASLSLGAPRDFMLRHIKYKENKTPVEKFILTDGDMVVMRGRTQHDWQHSIPKRKSAEGRINITFRKGIVKYASQNYYQYNVGSGPMYRWKGGKMVEQQ